MIIPTLGYLEPQGCLGAIIKKSIWGVNNKKLQQKSVSGLAGCLRVEGEDSGYSPPKPSQCVPTL